MSQFPNASNPGPFGVNPPALYNGNVRNLAGPARTVTPDVSTSSAPIRLFDPVTISAGLISRGSASSAALYGFAAEPGIRTELAQFPTMPFYTDTVSGVTYKRNAVYVAGGGNEFEMQVKYGVTLQNSYIGATCDLAPVVVAPTPVITQGGSAGAATVYYTAVPFTLVGEAKGPNGTSTASSQAIASLTTTDYNIITIPYVAGALGFNIYRGTANNNGTLIQQIVQTAHASGQNTVFNDTGYASQGAALVVSTTDNCGWVIDPATSSTNVMTIREFIEPNGTLSAPNTICRVIAVVTVADSQWA